jgi:membrane associated rhomboid family serine protease
MGVQDRDYNRAPRYGGRGYDDGGSYSGGSLGGVTPVVKWLVLANVLVFLAQIFSFHDARPAMMLQLEQAERELEAKRNRGDPEAANPDDELRELERQRKLANLFMRDSRTSYVQEWLDLDVEKVLHGQLWRLVTHAFCHDTNTPWHIVFNMLFLWWWGPVLEAMRGSREFLLFYMGALLTSAFGFVGLDLAMGTRGIAIGASGAVMGVLALYAYYYPRSIIYILYVIPIEMRFFVALYAIYDLFPVLLQLSGRSVADGVAHAGHLGGLTFGYLYGRRGWHLSTLAEPISGLVASWTARRPVRRSNRNLRVFDPDAEPIGPRLMQPDPPNDERLQEELDDVLRKMHEVGRAGLTPAELAILDEASARLSRKRRPE